MKSNASLREQMAQDQEAPPSALNLEQLRQLIARLLGWQERIATLEVQLKEALTEATHLQTVAIPTLLDQCGVERLTLDGRRIEVKTEIRPYVKVEDQPRFFRWLRQHQFDGIIKNEVKVIFGAKQDQSAIDLTADLLSRHYDVTQKETIHPNTLKAFVKEQLERLDHGEGVPLPEVLAVNPTRTITIK